MVPVSGVTSFVSTGIAPDGHQAIWAFDTQRKATAKERVGWSKSCKDGIAKGGVNALVSALEAAAEGDDSASWCAFVEDEQGVLWVSTGGVTIVCAGTGRFVTEVGRVTMAGDRPKAALALFRDFERHETGLVDTWAKSPNAKNEKDLLDVFPPNLCMISGLLSRQGLSGGTFMFMKAGN